MNWPVVFRPEAFPFDGSDAARGLFYLIRYLGRELNAYRERVRSLRGNCDRIAVRSRISDQNGLSSDSVTFDQSRQFGYGAHFHFLHYVRTVNFNCLLDGA
jgi:hypothetical protein